MRPQLQSYITTFSYPFPSFQFSKVCILPCRLLMILSLGITTCLLWLVHFSQLSPRTFSSRNCQYGAFCLLIDLLQGVTVFPTTYHSQINKEMVCGGGVRPTSVLSKRYSYKRYSYITRTHANTKNYYQILAQTNTPQNMCIHVKNILLELHTVSDSVQHFRTLSQFCITENTFKR